MLNIPMTEEDLLGVIQQMNPNKALGRDGFSTHFYKKCWDIIKQYILIMVQYFHRSAKMGGNTNSTFLALVLKEVSPTSFTRFRPISLCNVSYKFISKFIANFLKHLLPKIISPNQGGFVEET
jgi:hypothetical protein